MEHFRLASQKFPQVKLYIANQKEHHRKQTFQEELINLLEEHGIKYDERYLWN